MTKRILQTLSDQKTDRVPFWFMRQAGRYLPEYQKSRLSAGGFLDMVYNPDFAIEVTLQPIRRFGMDAAILFSDILVIPHAMGQGLRFEEGRGPILEALSSIDDLNRLKDADIHQTLDPVYKTITGLRSALGKDHPDVTLIGFSGAPWTVATYMIEGGGSKTFELSKAWAYEKESGFDTLVDILVDRTADYLVHQVKAGAEVLQIFDTWASVLDNRGFKDWVINPTKRIVEKVKSVYSDIPIIGFPKGAADRLPDYAINTGVDGVGLDYSISLDTALKIPEKITLQGNLDPIRLFGPHKNILAEAEYIKSKLSGRRHIFNLGHGFQPKTPIAAVEALSEFLKG